MKPFRHTLRFALTDHVEAPRNRSSDDVYQEVASHVRLADEVGIDTYWFSEHHSHAHYGHLPAPLLFALHLASQTQRISLGTAIICLNLHHPLDVAEQTATADLLMSGRLSPGFGSGSTPEEFAQFGQAVTVERDRHERFQSALKIITDAWRGEVAQERDGPFPTPGHAPLPTAAPDLKDRSWLAVNSEGSAKIAGTLGFNMMFSHLRTPVQNRKYVEIYRSEGGKGLVAANRPVYVGATDPAAQSEVETPLRTLWRRFQREGKIPKAMEEPKDLREAAGHPINFLFGSPETVAEQIHRLRGEFHFDVINLEPNWEGLTPAQIRECIRRIGCEVRLQFGAKGSP